MLAKVAALNLRGVIYTRIRVNKVSTCFKFNSTNLRLPDRAAVADRVV